jgi:Leucine-rich repeat (LRR) protein
VNLKFLDLGYGDITSIPDSIIQLKELEMLNLFGHKLSKLPKELPKNLKILILRSNQFKEIPESVEDLNSLKVLDISMNEISIIKSFKKLDI